MMFWSRKPAGASASVNPVPGRAMAAPHSEADSDSSYQLVGLEDAVQAKSPSRTSSELGPAELAPQRSATASPDLAAADAILGSHLAVGMESSQTGVNTGRAPSPHDAPPPAPPSPPPHNPSDTSRNTLPSLLRAALGMGPRSGAPHLRPRRYSIGPGVVPPAPVPDPAGLVELVANLEEERDMLAARLLDTDKALTDVRVANWKLANDAAAARNLVDALISAQPPSSPRHAGAAATADVDSQSVPAADEDSAKSSSQSVTTLSRRLRRVLDELSQSADSSSHCSAWYRLAAQLKGSAALAALLVSLLTLVCLLQFILYGSLTGRAVHPPPRILLTSGLRHSHDTFPLQPQSSGGRQHLDTHTVALLPYLATAAANYSSTAPSIACTSARFTRHSPSRQVASTPARFRGASMSAASAQHLKLSSQQAVKNGSSLGGNSNTSASLLIQRHQSAPAFRLAAKVAQPAGRPLWPLSISLSRHQQHVGCGSLCPALPALLAIQVAGPPPQAPGLTLLPINKSANNLAQPAPTALLSQCMTTVVALSKELEAARKEVMALRAQLAHKPAASHSQQQSVTWVPSATNTSSPLTRPSPPPSPPLLRSYTREPHHLGLFLPPSTALPFRDLCSLIAATRTGWMRLLLHPSRPSPPPEPTPCPAALPLPRLPAPPALPPSQFASQQQQLSFDRRPCLNLARHSRNGSESMGSKASSFLARLKLGLRAASGEAAAAPSSNASSVKGTVPPSPRVGAHHHQYANASSWLMWLSALAQPLFNVGHRLPTDAPDLVALGSSHVSSAWAAAKQLRKPAIAWRLAQQQQVLPTPNITRQVKPTAATTLPPAPPTSPAGRAVVSLDIQLSALPGRLLPSIFNPFASASLHKPCRSMPSPETYNHQLTTATTGGQNLNSSAKQARSANSYPWWQCLPLSRFLYMNASTAPSPKAPSRAAAPAARPAVTSSAKQQQGQEVAPALALDSSQWTIRSARLLSVELPTLAQISSLAARLHGASQSIRRLPLQPTSRQVSANVTALNQLLAHKSGMVTGSNILASCLSACQAKLQRAYIAQHPLATMTREVASVLAPTTTATLLRQQTGAAALGPAIAKVVKEWVRHAQVANGTADECLGVHRTWAGHLASYAQEHATCTGCGAKLRHVRSVGGGRSTCCVLLESEAEADHLLHDLLSGLSAQLRDGMKLLQMLGATPTGNTQASAHVVMLDRATAQVA